MEDMDVRTMELWAVLALHERAPVVGPHAIVVANSPATHWSKGRCVSSAPGYEYFVVTKRLPDGDQGKQRWQLHISMPADCDGELLPRERRECTGSA